MCKELELIQTHLGIWKLEDWTVQECSTQLNKKIGIYCIKNIINSKLLIGEGTLGGYGSRLLRHIIGKSDNTYWKKDLEKYGQDNFRLIWIIPEENEVQRKLIENKLQLHFKENCYNVPRREYPTQKELLNNENNHFNSISILDRLNNYIKVQRNYIDECWESNLSLRGGYPLIKFNNRIYGHHILMYITHNGNVCGISSVIHHKCENKRCVNPKHLESTTNKKNIRIGYNSDYISKNIKTLYKNGFNTEEIAKKLNISKSVVYNNIKQETTSIYYGVSFYDNRYVIQIIQDSEGIRLGSYNSEIHAAQNRDYYIVKNNLLDKRQATLNFHDMDYNNFTPYPQKDGKINKYLL